MITTFTDLMVWKKGHALVLENYKITAKFPRTETFALVDQMKRAVISITSNIAEGFGRRGYKEKIQFYYLSLGSLTELQNQLIVSKDVHYISQFEFDCLIGRVTEVSKLLNSLIKSIKFKHISPAP